MRAGCTLCNTQCRERIAHIAWCSKSGPRLARIFHASSIWSGKQQHEQSSPNLGTTYSPIFVCSEAGTGRRERSERPLIGNAEGERERGRGLVAPLRSRQLQEGRRRRDPRSSAVRVQSVGPHERLPRRTARRRWRRPKKKWRGNWEWRKGGGMKRARERSEANEGRRHHASIPAGPPWVGLRVSALWLSLLTLLHYYSSLPDSKWQNWQEIKDMTFKIKRSGCQFRR